MTAMAAELAMVRELDRLLVAAANATDPADRAARERRYRLARARAARRLGLATACSAARRREGAA